MHTVVAPLTQTVPSGSALIPMLADRPSRVPWETRSRVPPDELVYEEGSGL
ncbi:hypothetical protein [Streptomyces sp. NPDC018352]|uniref:hypothetical protein n=1 Tax=Streptomyces sp. NPDC018352 TaxID=3157194 RepID=UPI0033F1C959